MATATIIHWKATQEKEFVVKAKVTMDGNAGIEQQNALGRKLFNAVRQVLDVQDVSVDELIIEEISE